MNMRLVQSLIQKSRSKMMQSSKHEISQCTPFSYMSIWVIIQNGYCYYFILSYYSNLESFI